MKQKTFFIVFEGLSMKMGHKFYISKKIILKIKKKTAQYCKYFCIIKISSQNKASPLSKQSPL